MAKFILGKKLGMTTIHDADGAQNVTLVACGAKVNAIRTLEKNGYSALQLEIQKSKKKTARREFRLKDDKFENGAVLDVKQFAVGDIVDVRGFTKSKGFQGVVKRHGFSGSPQTHGHKHDLRAPGSIGAGFPEHVIKGKRMAGRMGGARATTKNIRIAYIDESKNILGLRGAVPGVPGSIVEIRSK